MTQIAFVYAEDEAGWIGLHQQLPWHIPEDMQHFKQVTMGHPMIMGRKTFDSIGRPLPGRKSIVVSRQEQSIQGAVVVHSVSELMNWIAAHDEHEPYMVIGGAQIFKLMAPYVNILYRTLVTGDHHGDTKMPQIDLAKWHLVNKKTGSLTDSAKENYVFEEWILNKK
ncbi:MAG TPA: dihydrofolate reductase [Candidatus Limosilactobacillus merdigallinarum]|uniref:Dihydrofolate reductase n=1 Tax=Candidatus Limosilactobacillus merdigallinarum TaxID=2838652 RepID=A0A9D1VIP2_9LACO|nr:dihydrofolate reductase [Candidatus Limosilactobacillus merdigallinarum]